MAYNLSMKPKQDITQQMSTSIKRTGQRRHFQTEDVVFKDHRSFQFNQTISNAHNKKEVTRFHSTKGLESNLPAHTSNQQN